MLIYFSQSKDCNASKRMRKYTNMIRKSNKTYKCWWHNQTLHNFAVLQLSVVIKLPSNQDTLSDSFIGIWANSCIISGSSLNISLTFKRHLPSRKNIAIPPYSAPQQSHQHKLGQLQDILSSEIYYLEEETKQYQWSGSGICLFHLYVAALFLVNGQLV